MQRRSRSRHSAGFPAALVLLLVACFCMPPLITEQQTWNERKNTATRAQATVLQHTIGFAEDSTYRLVYRFEARQSDGTTQTVIKTQGVEEEFYHQTPDGATVTVVFASVNPDNAVLEGTGSNPTLRVVSVFFLAGVGFLYCLWSVLSLVRLAPSAPEPAAAYR
jgi:hypothetical protein